MKKYLICIVLILSLSHQAYSQKDVSQFLNKISSTDNVEKVKIGQFLMSLVKLTGSMEGVPAIKGIQSMEVLSLEECDNKLKQEFSEQVNSLKDGGGYVTLFQVKEEGEGIRIVMKKEKETISEVVLFCMDKDDPAIIRFKGKIKESDLAQLTKQYNK